MKQNYVRSERLKQMLKLRMIIKVMVMPFLIKVTDPEGGDCHSKIHGSREWNAQNHACGAQQH
jgi:hypothetical protein